MFVFGHLRVLLQPSKAKSNFDFKFLLDIGFQQFVNFHHVLVLLSILEVYTIRCFVKRCVVNIVFSLLRIKTTCLHFIIIIVRANY